MSLYEIDNDLRGLLANAAEASEDMTIEETDNFLALFEELGIDRKQKFDSTVDFIKSEEAIQDEIDKEIARLTLLKSPSVKKCQRLKDYLELSMRNAGETELRANRHEFKIKKNPASMKTSEEFDVAANLSYNVMENEGLFKASKKQLSEYKASVKTDLKAGKEVDGAWLVQAEKFVIK